jgi:hypothetical protein
MPGTNVVATKNAKHVRAEPGGPKSDCTSGIETAELFLHQNAGMIAMFHRPREPFFSYGYRYYSRTGRLAAADG